VCLASGSEAIFFRCRIAWFIPNSSSTIDHYLQRVSKLFGYGIATRVLSGEVKFSTLLDQAIVASRRS
jgi:hypothetical protein